LGHRDQAQDRRKSFAGSASVAQLGQKYAVNANQIFLWRKQYREGRLDNNTPTKLLPVES
jgi:transposase-like protein